MRQPLSPKERAGLVGLSLAIVIVICIMLLRHNAPPATVVKSETIMVLPQPEDSANDVTGKKKEGKKDRRKKSGHKKKGKSREKREMSLPAPRDFLRDTIPTVR